MFNRKKEVMNAKDVSLIQSWEYMTKTKDSLIVSVRRSIEAHEVLKYIANGKNKESLEEYAKTLANIVDMSMTNFTNAVTSYNKQLKETKTDRLYTLEYEEYSLTAQDVVIMAYRNYWKK